MARRSADWGRGCGVKKPQQVQEPTMTMREFSSNDTFKHYNKSNARIRQRLKRGSKLEQGSWKPLGPSAQSVISSEPFMSTRKCNLNHSGNHTLHETTGGWLECAGCGAFYGQAKVAPRTSDLLPAQPQPIPQPKPISQPKRPL
jgi:hypothetical protein